MKKLFLLSILVIGMAGISAAQQSLTLSVEPVTGRGDTTAVLNGMPKDCILVHLAVDKSKKIYYALVRPGLGQKENIDYKKFRLFWGTSEAILSEIKNINVMYEDHDFAIKYGEVEVELTPYHGKVTTNGTIATLEKIPHK